LKQPPDGCSRVVCGLGVNGDNLSQQLFSRGRCTRLIERWLATPQTLNPTRTCYVHWPIRDWLQQLFQPRDPNFTIFWQGHDVLSI
jgi:hypothetical protein